MARPKKIIDYEQVEKLAKIHCTQAEIGSVLGFNRKQFERDKKLKEVYEKGLEFGKSSLRRKQMEVALSGNPTMLIWMGKQLLGQKERIEQNNITEISKLDELLDNINKKADETD